jgi:subtilase family serine protease
MIRGNFKVENLGVQNAEPSSIYFYLSKDETLDGTDIQVGTKSVGALEAGQAVDISFKAFYSKRETYTYVIAKIDHGNAISESDENNNIIVSWPF